MQKSLRLLLTCSFYFLFVSKDFLIAQPVLKPSIGLSALPNDADPICPIPLSIDTTYLYNTVGLQEGDTIPDFKLYTLTNDSVHISEVLTSGKPVLLIGGSYTCPKYRNHLNEVKDLYLSYGTQINIYILYTVEAHPAAPDISPYKGDEWELNSNIQDGIIYHQPLTYLERKDIVSDMLAALDIEVPVLIDGPCNEWWTSFALAPNPALLIDPNGIVCKKQPWFDNGLYAMSYAIDTLLQGLTTNIYDVEESAPFFTVINDPSSSHIQFIFSAQQQDRSIKLFDVTGRLILFEHPLTDNLFTLDGDQYSPGIYFYSVSAGGKTGNGKILMD